MPRVAPLLLCLVACGLLAAVAAAQTLNNYNISATTQERLSENHWKLSGNVELEQKDTKLYADEVEWFTDENRAIATGNVVFTQGNNRIAADRAEFNTETRLGTFFGASGIANVQPPRQRMSGMGGMGGFAPPISSQQTDVYFFGDVIEKIGAKKYRITNGGFSTCVQPTPRWDMHADTVVLNIDHYTMLRNAVLNVKGVPMFYVPVIYYPTKEDGRATGILIPTYGASSLRGQAIHNAFFWAINRSQDATFMHDWYSKAGQGFGSEYRYNFGGGSDGTLTAHLLNQNATSGSTGALLPQTRAYEIRGFANQMLPGQLRARFTADYFSSVSVNQSFNTDIYNASRNSRYFGGNVVGAWRTFSLNGTFDRREFFATTTSSWVQGSTPRVSLARNERPLFRNAPIYFSASSEFVRIDRQTRENKVVTDDSGVTRVDVTPQVRYPFKKWQWFTVNSSLSWRDTYYTRSRAVNSDGSQGPVIEDNLNRRYYEMSANAIGPVFNRIFDTRESGFAERWKHTVEPFFNVQRRSAVDAFNRIIQNDATDTVVGNTTNLTYGMNNRLYAKRRGSGGRPAMAQEILALEIVQTYYSSATASQFDTRFQTSFIGGTTRPSNFSPVQVNLRATPTQAVNATLRAEIDSKYKALRTLGANSTLNIASRVQAQVAWTKRFYIEELQGFNDRGYLDHMLNVMTNVHSKDNRVGVVHAFNYDFLRKGMLNQRISAFYNAQCCGIAFEYQTFNYAGLGSLLPPDRRFFLSFTLAGLGNFSPFNGGMNGVPR